MDPLTIIGILVGVAFAAAVVWTFIGMRRDSRRERKWFKSRRYVRRNRMHHA